MAVHSSCLSGSHCGRWRTKLQVQRRQTDQRPCMHRLGSQAAPGCIPRWPACVERSMASDPDGHSVVPKSGTTARTGERVAPANRAQVPAHRPGRRAPSGVTKDGQPLGPGGYAALRPHLGWPPTLPRPGDPGPAGNPVRAILSRLGRVSEGGSSGVSWRTPRWTGGRHRLIDALPVREVSMVGGRRSHCSWYRSALTSRSASSQLILKLAR
jgi:hypothetical protein